MKKGLNILALAAVLVGLAAPAFAAGFTINNKMVQPGALTNGLMRFKKFATTDSTQVAVAPWATGTAVAGAQDTTAWLDLGGLVFPGTISSSVNLLDFQINHQTGVATDSVGYILQWTNDPATASGSASKFTTAAHSIALPAGGNSSIVAGLTSGTAAGRWVRVIVYNLKVASGAARLFSVQPILRVPS